MPVWPGPIGNRIPWRAYSNTSVGCILARSSLRWTVFIAAVAGMLRGATAAGAIGSTSEPPKPGATVDPNSPVLMSGLNNDLHERLVSAAANFEAQHPNTVA